MVLCVQIPSHGLVAAAIDIFIALYKMLNNIATSQALIAAV